MNIFILYYFLGINLLAYTIYYIDKKKARNGSYRVSESTLLFLVLAGGNVGSLLSMLINRHKTKKLSFIMKYVLINILFVFLLFYNDLIFDYASNRF